MTSIRYYTDSHVPKQVATQLRNRGVDVLRCQDIGLEDATDVVHLERATADMRTVISGDEDFLRLNAEWNDAERFHAGIVYFRRELQGNIGLIVKQAFFLYEAVEQGAATPEDDVYNRVIFVEMGRGI